MDWVLALTFILFLAFVVKPRMDRFILRKLDEEIARKRRDNEGTP